MSADAERRVGRVVLAVAVVVGRVALAGGLALAVAAVLLPMNLAFGNPWDRALYGALLGGGMYVGGWIARGCLEPDRSDDHA